ncbi:MAG: acetoacetate--CoA ligase [Leptonema sp. (in: Bacteria)]|nr:acetoacetate--CoA ligase [Leptonema sp. (in: bacteria)]
MSNEERNKILWNPPAPQETQLFDFITRISKTDSKVVDWPSLQKWSLENSDRFWSEFTDYSKLIYDGSATPAIELGAVFSQAKFFPQIKINMAENLMRHVIKDVESGSGKKVRIHFHREDGLFREVTSTEIVSTVRKLQLAMKAVGVEPGDRVATYLPNIPETIMIMLAAVSIGATFSSSAPDFGANAVLDRFKQIQPKLLFAADQVLYRGKIIDKTNDIIHIQSELKELQKLIILPLETAPTQIDSTIKVESAVSFNSFMAIATDDRSLLEFVRLPFSHPVYIMYSSGTTGLPKCMVQGCGVLVNQLKEMILHTDVKESESIFYFTTCGWMMWNWLVSSLAVGALMVLYDGHPFMPDANVLWKMAERSKVNVFGTSAGYLAALQKSNFDLSSIDISSIRSILSTGSPLLPEQFDFVYSSIKKDVQLSSISGGTDLNGCFVLGNPILPVRRGEIQSAGLGMAVDVVDDKGKSVAFGIEGELVCRKPFPSQPLFFWNDTDGSRYHSAYFDVYPNIWRHGDFITRTESGGFQIQGRSDATLNPGGVRIGTADLYRVVDSITEITDSLVIGPTIHGEVKILLFVLLRQDENLDNKLIDKIRTELKQKASPRHVPEKIFAITEIPYTLNMKKVELAVRNIFENRPVTNRDSLSNPECLDEYIELAKEYRNQTL